MWMLTLFSVTLCCNVVCGMFDLPVANLDNDDGDFMDDVRAFANFILGYGKKTTTIIKKGWRVSRSFVGEVSHQLSDKSIEFFDTVDSYDVPSEVFEELMDVTSNLKSTVMDIY